MLCFSDITSRYLTDIALVQYILPSPPSDNNLVKIKVVQDFFRRFKSKSGLYFGLSLVFKDVRSWFLGTHGCLCRLLQHVKFLVKTRQSSFPELQSILDSFQKKNGKKINNCLGT